MNKNILVIALLFFHNIILGQPVDFRTADSFAVFTNNGAVSNEGLSDLNGGDYGADGVESVISGFVTAVNKGTPQLNNTITEQARLDLTSAFNDLWAIPYNFTHGAAIGTETITPGVYYIESASSFDGTITLDANNDPNALFMFKITGAFNIQPYSEIELINGAQAGNVFWLIKGAVDIGIKSDLHGTFISAPGAITIRSGTFLTGRVFSTTGAIAINNLNVSNPPISSYTYFVPVPLSIKLISFTAECSHESTIFKWSTASERNNDYFSIEQSTDGINWKSITTMNGAGNSTSRINYSFDYTTRKKGTCYYRLKQVNYNGQFNYSPIIAQKTCNEAEYKLILYPTPVNEQLNLDFRGNKNTVMSVSIYNLLGEVVYFSEHFESKIALTNQLNGLYFLHLELASTKKIKKFVIEK
jgi:hypothetical protein